MELDSRQQDVKNYYGEVLQSSSDLKTSACCPIDSVPEHHRNVLVDIHAEILDRFYGCGSPLPVALKGCRVLDLGCGTGRDAYVASKLVGDSGHVIGVDMTEAQLTVARRHLNHQMKLFGYDQPNIRFEHGTIEDLKSLAIEDNSIDVVISNCVINLSASKHAVFSEIFRVLAVGGELLFADIFADRRLPEHMQNDPVLVGECLGGALYIEDFRRLLRQVGCLDYRVMETSEVQLESDIRAKVGDVRFFSMTIRAFKLTVLEDICEDYGQQAMYRGSIDECPESFVLDDHHKFDTGVAVKVCGNTAAMLQQTRYASHFEIKGDTSNHLGAFDCAPIVASSSAGSCC